MVKKIEVDVVCKDCGANCKAIKFIPSWLDLLSYQVLTDVEETNNFNLNSARCSKCRLFYQEIAKKKKEFEQVKMERKQKEFRERRDKFLKELDRK